MAEKKKNSSTVKVVLIAVALIAVLFLVQIGSCVYRIVKNMPIDEIKAAQATDAEINEYRMFLENNIELAMQETEKYEDIVPREIRHMEFESYAEASKTYYDLYEERDTMDEESEKLAEAYLAYGKYYAALAAKAEFDEVMKIPKLSKIFIKVLMDKNDNYKDFTEAENDELSE
ncbi:MAG: hypothetical protein FWH43_01285 [Endomicrobia bacterium]|nr:hypothetical protein [Endomicrobiia bacterium]